PLPLYLDHRPLGPPRIGADHDMVDLVALAAGARSDRPPGAGPPHAAFRGGVVGHQRHRLRLLVLAARRGRTPQTGTAQGPYWGSLSVPADDARRSGLTGVVAHVPGLPISGVQH